MSNTADSTQFSRAVLSLSAMALVLLAVTATLWSYYGTAVFFEIVRTGWVACFG